eukprot:285668_1
MCVPQNYNLKDLSKDEKSQLSSSSINQIQAKELKDGMWCIHSETGYSGQIKSLKKIKCAKHGHCKVVYELRLPHNNTVKKESFKIKQIIKQSLVNKFDYLVSYYDQTTNQVVCFNDDFEQVYLSISNNKNNKIFDKLLKCIDSAENKDCYVTVIELPKVSLKNEDDVEILQIIYDVKSIDPN